MCEVEVTGAPSMFSVIRKTAALAIVSPTLALSCEKNDSQAGRACESSDPSSDKKDVTFCPSLKTCERKNKCTKHISGINLRIKRSLWSRFAHHQIDNRYLSICEIDTENRLLSQPM